MGRSVGIIIIIIIFFKIYINTKQWPGAQPGFLITCFLLQKEGTSIQYLPEAPPWLAPTGKFWNLDTPDCLKMSFPGLDRSLFQGKGNFLITDFCLFFNFRGGTIFFLVMGGFPLPPLVVPLMTFRQMRIMLVYLHFSGWDKFIFSIVNCGQYTGFPTPSPLSRQISDV